MQVAASRHAFGPNNIKTRKIHIFKYKNTYFTQTPVYKAFFKSDKRNNLKLTEHCNVGPLWGATCAHVVAGDTLIETRLVDILRSDLESRGRRVLMKRSIPHEPHKPARWWVARGEGWGTMKGFCRSLSHLYAHWVDLSLTIWFVWKRHTDNDTTTSNQYLYRILLTNQSGCSQIVKDSMQIWSYELRLHQFTL